MFVVTHQCEAEWLSVWGKGQYSRKILTHGLSNSISVRSSVVPE